MYHLKLLNKIKNNISTSCSVLLIILFFYILFFYCNIVYSGYHITDDHEIYYFSSIINKNNFIELFNRFISFDGRFRPVYWAHRISLFYFFKTNFFLYYFEYFILSITTALMIFFISKKFLPAFTSLLITAFTLFSCEYHIFLGLGYGELLSCTLLTISVFFIIFPVKNHKFLKNTLFFIFFILTIYSKETFLIAGPFILLIKFFYENRNKIEKQNKKNNIIYLLSLFSFVILGIILNIQYDNNSNNYTVILNIEEIKTSFIDIIYSVKYLSFEYIILIIFSIIGFFLIINKEKKWQYINYILTGILLLFSQLLFLSLFSKDNTFQIRYFFPAYFSGTIILITIFYFIKKQIFKIFFYIFLVISTLYNMQAYSLKDIIHSSNSNILFNKTLANTREILSKEDNILLIGDAVFNMEYFESLVRNYNYYGFKKVYLLPLINRQINELNNFEKNLYNFFPQNYKNYLYQELKTTPELIIVFLSENKEQYKTESGINFAEYKKLPIENHTTEFYLKRDKINQNKSNLFNITR